MLRAVHTQLQLLQPQPRKQSNAVPVLPSHCASSCEDMVKLCLILGSTFVLVLDPQLLGHAGVAEFRAVCSLYEQVEKQIGIGLE